MANILMTRKEAISKCHGIAYPEAFVQALEALGLLRIEPDTTPQENEAREKFRQSLDAVGHPEATCYSHWVLEAYDKAFCPNLRK